jgi:uncharacterized integral membrane protein (TIGR00697 family)
MDDRHDTDAGLRGGPHFAITGAGVYPYVLLSNIGATKFIAVGPLTFDGGAILFPLTYIVGDVLSEVYGFRAARRAIVLAFAMSILAALTLWIIQLAPAADFWANQSAFEAVLGFVPAIVLASILGFLSGQLVNAYVLVRVKERTREGRLWLRLMSSTVAGEFVDTLVFCTIYGIAFGLAFGDFLNYLIVGFIYKVGVEALLLPVTYRVIAAVKRREPTYAIA